jgi:single-stranded DNA-binding protein
MQTILQKGRQVYVEGRPRTRDYEAKNDGGKRQRTEIVALRVQFLSPPPVGKADASGNPSELIMTTRTLVSVTYSGRMERRHLA